jgi:hypothetical protein
MAREIRLADATVVRAVETPFALTVTAFAQDRAGRLLLGSQAGLYLSDPPRTLAGPPRGRLPVRAAADPTWPDAGFAPDGSIWISRRRQLDLLDASGRPGPAADASAVGRLHSLGYSALTSPIATAHYGKTAYVQTIDGQILSVTKDGASPVGIERLAQDPASQPFPTLLYAKDDWLVTGVPNRVRPGTYQSIDVFRMHAGSPPVRTASLVPRQESAVTRVEPAEPPGTFYVTPTFERTISRLDRDGTVHKLPAPPTEPGGRADAFGALWQYVSTAVAGPTEVGAGSAAAGALYCNDGNAVWRWDESSGWHSVLELVRPAETTNTVWGIRCDAEGAEVLLGSGYPGPYRVQKRVDVQESGQDQDPWIDPQDFQAEVADNRGMTYDPEGRLWAFTPAGIYRRDRPGAPFALVSAKLSSDSAWARAAARINPQAVVFANDRVWVVTSNEASKAGEFLWLIERDKEPQRIELDKLGARSISGCVRFADESGDRIWLCGDEILHTINPATLEVSDRRSLLDRFRQPGSTVPIQVWGMAEDGDGLLLLLPQRTGLVRVERQAVGLNMVDVDLTGFTDYPPSWGYIKRLASGRAVFLTRTGRTSRSGTAVVRAETSSAALATPGRPMLRSTALMTRSCSAVTRA